MPMQRWMHRAAGGTSQRLNPAVAMVRSRSRKPAPAPESVPALSMVDMHSSPEAALLNGLPRRSCSSACSAAFVPAAPHNDRRAPGSSRASETLNPLTLGAMPDATAGLLSMAHLLRISQARLDLRVSAEELNWGRSGDRCR